MVQRDGKRSLEGTLDTIYNQASKLGSTLMETVERRANAWRTPPPVLSDAVYQDLLERILAGTYKPGALLRQEELAARYSVSRVPVREAMSRLASDGLLVFRPRRGYVVKELDAREIK
jgi:DNA-binding GntR family transcriptional regulator